MSDLNIYRRDDGIGLIVFVFSNKEGKKRFPGEFLFELFLAKIVQRGHELIL
jgi:hypothetical protein